MSTGSQDGFLVCVWKSDSFAHRGVWQSHCITSGPAESSVSLCCVWWGGGKCRWAVGRGWRRGRLRDILFLSHLWLEIPLDALSLTFVFSPSPYLPPLASRPSRFVSVCLPPSLPSAFMPLCFSLGESSHLLPTLPYVSKFSPVLFLPSRHTWGWNWATSLTPSAISGDYCNAVCIHLCFYLPSQSFVVIFFFILLWLNRWWWTTFRHIRECRSNLKCSVFYQTRGMGLF